MQTGFLCFNTNMQQISGIVYDADVNKFDHVNSLQLNISGIMQIGVEKANAFIRLKDALCIV